MNLLNETPLLVAPVFGALPSGEGFAVIVKGTFAFVDGGVAAIASKRERQPLSGEQPFEPASPERARYATDFAPHKRFADVTLIGTHHPDPRRRDARSEVTLTVGTLRKSLALSPSDAPHALLGFAPVAEASPSRRASLGTFDDVWLKTRWPYFPVDFDWSAHNAAPPDQRTQGYLRGDERVRIEGLRPDAPRLETTLPDVRPRVFVRRNGAAPSGAEELPLVLDTLWVDADAGVLVLLWRGALATSTPRGAEVDALLLAVEPHGSVAAPLATFQQPDRWRRANGRPASVSAKPTAATKPPAAATREEASAKVEPPTDEEVEAQPTDAMVLAEMRASLEEAGAPPEVLGLFQGADSLEALQATITASLPAGTEAPDPEKLAADAEVQRRAFLKEAGLDLSEFERAEAELAQADADAEAADEAAERQAEAAAAAGTPQAEASPLDRDAVVLRLRRGDDLAGANLRGLDLTKLDLSRAKLAGADLEGADLSGSLLLGADLAGANLRAIKAVGANLDKVLAEGVSLDAANLERASLRQANLAKASARAATFVGATLDGADGHGAVFASANFDGASLKGVDFGAATLDGARLVTANATSAIFRGASLLDVDARGADLSSANATGAVAHRASFEGATLANASFDGVRGDDVRFDGAKARKWRAGRGAMFVRARFQAVDAERATFSGAILDGADFSNAVLPSAAFREASLTGANFHLAKLESSDFTRANLAGARLTKVNLFQARLPEVDLTGADCRLSNFFGAEFFRATVAGALFDGSNIGRTKLEGGLVR